MSTIINYANLKNVLKETYSMEHEMVIEKISNQWIEKMTGKKLEAINCFNDGLDMVYFKLNQYGGINSFRDPNIVEYISASREELSTIEFVEKYLSEIVEYCDKHGIHFIDGNAVKFRTNVKVGENRVEKLLQCLKEFKPIAFYVDSIW